MANVSNENLILKIRGISDRIKQIQDEAGDILVRNIRSQARQKFNNDPKYPYEFRNSFQNDNVVYHDKNEHAVFVDHPAAKRLEYGFGDITIKTCRICACCYERNSRRFKKAI